MSDPSPYAPPHSDVRVDSHELTNDHQPSIHQGRNAWVWWISALLLLATMLNYMDRQTLANLAVRIKKEILVGRENELYGNLEWGFGWAFAAGSLFFGFLSDRISVRILYPGILLAWSLIGALTGFCDSYASLLAARIALGFFEAGHWPCALRTTKILLDSRNRTLGNSILQSGGALGAILTPPVILLIVGNNQAIGAWRPPFVIIGSIGIIWVVAWLLSIKSTDLPAPTREKTGGDDGFLAECLTNRRFWTLVPVVICINLTWQLIRAWLPSFLQEGRGVSEKEALLFNSAYYVAADAGCIAAGAAALWLARRHFGVQWSRLLVFCICAALTSLTVVASLLPSGPALYSVLLIVAAGSLGLFPCYYSYTQEASENHMGKTGGLLGALAWLISSPIQKMFGKVVDETHSYDTGLALAGLAPIVAVITLALTWPKDASVNQR
ncbi:MAG: MFS transporter [Planctomycetota bacterium]